MESKETTQELKGKKEKQGKNSDTEVEEKCNEIESIRNEESKLIK